MAELIHEDFIRQCMIKRTRRHHLAMTLIECLLAIVILSMAMLAVIYTANAGHDHLRYSDRMLRAVRLAENLIEEIESRPYQGSGVSRATYCVDDYDEYYEAAGDLEDATGALYGDSDQIFSRNVWVTASTITVPDLSDAVILGKTITVTVDDGDGHQWQVTRFIPEPM